MPIDFEDRVDISGTPQSQPNRVRTPKTLGDQARKEAHQSERRPGKGSQQNSNPVGDAFSALGSAAHNAEESAGNAIQDAGFRTPHNVGFNPAANAVDWAQSMQQDAGAVWGLARKTAKTIGGAYSDGVANLFAGHDGTAKFGQSAAGFLADSIPLVGLQESMSNLGAIRDEAQGRITDEQRQQEMQGNEQEAVQQAPVTAALDVLGGTGPASFAGKAAAAAASTLPMVLDPNAPDILKELTSGDPDQQRAALIWMAFAGMNFAHLSGPVRQMLREHFGNSADLEQAIADAAAGRKTAERAAVDPDKSSQQTKDYIAQQLQRPGVPPFSKTVVKGVKPGEPRQVTAELGDSGEIKLLTGEANKKRQQLLTKLGVSDLAELEQKAGTAGGFTGKTAKLIRENWRTLGMPYDLQHVAPGEGALRDPRAAAEAITNEDVAGKVTAHLSDLNHYLAEVHSGLFTSSRNPAQAILRNLAGLARTTDLVHGSYMRSAADALGAWGNKASNRELLTRAAEGDAETYESLPAEAKAVVDGFGLLRSALREQSQGTSYAKSFVANWFPRLDQLTEENAGRGRPSTAAVLAREARRKRALAINLDPSSGHLVVGQRFRTVADSNAAIDRARTDLVSHLLDSNTALRADFTNDPEANAIRRLAKTDVPAATERAQQLAVDRMPNKSQDFLHAVGRAAGYQAKAIQTAKALNELERTVIKAKRPGGGSVTRAAVVNPKTQRQLEEFRNQGYEGIDDPRFRGFMFDGGFAKDLNRYVSHVNTSPTRTTAWFAKLLDIEKTLVGWVMFSPMVHALNVAGRAGVAALSNPLETASYLSRGRAILPHMADDESYALRREAWQSGVLPMRKAKGWADNALGTLSDALGDTEDIPVEHDDSITTKAGRMASLVQQVPRTYHGVNDYFWGMVHDFAIGMYHLEKTAAVKHGLDETTARLYAARRANSWAGLVAPEDTNPMWHDISRLGFFAPNWWRTWGELMVPLYRRSGLINDDKMMKHLASQSAKTLVAARAFQMLTGNLMNYVMTSSTPWAHDGHLQFENQPQNRDRVEATGQWLDDIPLAGHLFGETPAVDPSTGAVRTMENPFGRQQFATLTAAGLASGQPGYQFRDTEDGMSKFIAGRFSPLLDGMASGLNVDLYQTLVNGQMRAAMQGQDPLTISPGSLVAGALVALPGGLNFQQQLQHNMNQNPNDDTSLFGTRVPKSVVDFLPPAGSSLERGLWNAMTGTNAPYGSAQRTRGTTISDQDYEKARQAQQQYTQNLQVLDAEALSGQMTPAQWRKAYSSIANKHSDQMGALFKGAPEYVNGGDGLANEWSALYDQAQAADGTTDQAKLYELQAQFRSQHSPEQMQQMNAILRKRDTQYPMLALYHKTLDKFDAWQEQWAASQGLDVTRIRSEASTYSSLFGDAAAQRKYVQQHPEFNRYQHAKTSQFERSKDGVLYSLFNGSNAAVNRYLRARHLTASQLINEESAA